MRGSSWPLLADLEPVLGLFRRSGRPILGKLGTSVGQVWGLAGGFWRLKGKTKNRKTPEVSAKYRSVFCARGSKIRGCAAAGVKVGYMGLSKVYTWQRGSTWLKMAQPGPNIGQIGGKMIGPSSVWKLPIKRKLFVIASQIG